MPQTGLGQKKKQLERELGRNKRSKRNTSAAPVQYPVPGPLGTNLVTTKGPSSAAASQVQQEKTERAKRAAGELAELTAATQAAAHRRDSWQQLPEQIKQSQLRLLDSKRGFARATSACKIFSERCSDTAADLAKQQQLWVDTVQRGKKAEAARLEGVIAGLCRGLQILKLKRTAVEATRRQYMQQGRSDGQYLLERFSRMGILEGGVPSPWLPDPESAQFKEQLCTLGTIFYFLPLELLYDISSVEQLGEVPASAQHGQLCESVESVGTQGGQLRDDTAPMEVSMNDDASAVDEDM